MQHSVHIGDRFRLAGPPHFLWEVEGMTLDPEGLPHARLVRVDFPKESRMVATGTLRDRRFFEAVGKDSEYSQIPRMAPIRRFFTALRAAS